MTGGMGLFQLVCFSIFLLPVLESSSLIFVFFSLSEIRPLSVNQIVESEEILAACRKRNREHWRK